MPDFKDKEFAPDVAPEALSQELNVSNRVASPGSKGMFFEELDDWEISERERSGAALQDNECAVVEWRWQIHVTARVDERQYRLTRADPITQTEFKEGIRTLLSTLQGDQSVPPVHSPSGTKEYTFYRLIIRKAPISFQENERNAPEQALDPPGSCMVGNANTETCEGRTCVRQPVEALYSGELNAENTNIAVQGSLFLQQNTLWRQLV